MKKNEISVQEAKEIREWLYKLVDEFEKINPVYSIPLSWYVKTREDVTKIPDDELLDYERNILREFDVSDAEAEPFYKENNDVSD